MAKIDETNLCVGQFPVKSVAGQETFAILVQFIYAAYFVRIAIVQVDRSGRVVNFVYFDAFDFDVQLALSTIANVGRTSTLRG